MILNAELDPCVAPGFTGGPEWATLIKSLRSGMEARNAQWVRARHRYTCPFQNIDQAGYIALKTMHSACRGMLYGFLFRDPHDDRATNESLGVAPSGSAPVQIAKVSTVDGVSYARKIQFPVAPVVQMADGVGGWVTKAGTVDDQGLFTPSTAWTAGRALRWSGEFLVPVRFNSDWLVMSREDFDVASGEVELIEVFGESLAP